jgi:chlorobactene glucosyltransferase
MDTMDLLLAILALGYLVLWLVLLEVRFESHLKAIPTLSRSLPPPEECPPVCVFVPARNEEAAIEASLRSLLAQDYPGLRIVAADDHSTDRTPQILQRLEAEFGLERLLHFRVPDLPDGWMGKCHALFHAVKHAPPDAELYLFTDADILHEAGTLRRAVGHLKTDGAQLMAIFPALDCVGFWERICFPLLVHNGITALRVHHLNDPSRPVAAGVGAFSLVSRDIYEAIGGHEAIKAEVIDDMALALEVKRQGGRLCLARDPQAVHLRMYDSLGAIISGFEKNFYTALGGKLTNIAIVSVIYALMHLTPLLFVALPLLAPSLDSAWILVGLLLWFATGSAIMLRTRVFIRVGHGWLAAFACPAAAMVMLVVFARSAWHCGVRGIIPWRGRRIKRSQQNVRLV